MSVSDVYSRRLLALLWRTPMAMLLWWVLAEGDMHGWGFALVFSLLAALLSLWLLPPTRPSGWLRCLPGWGRFIPFFLWQSLLGGVDVARRAFHPRLPLQPAIIHYPLQLADGWPRIFFLNTVSLLPGTLAVTLDGDTLQIHLLDEGRDPFPELGRVETMVRALFPDDPLIIQGREV